MSGFKRQPVMWGWVCINIRMTKVLGLWSLFGSWGINLSCSSENILYHLLTSLICDSKQCLIFCLSCNGKQLFQLTYKLEFKRKNSWIVSLLQICFVPVFSNTSLKQTIFKLHFWQAVAINWRLILQICKHKTVNCVGMNITGCSSKSRH